MYPWNTNRAEPNPIASTLQPSGTPKLQLSNIPSLSAAVTTIAQARGWLALLLAVVCVTAVALAANALRGRVGFAGRATFTPLSGAQVAVELDVSGSVTHLGQSSVHIHSVADVSGSSPSPIPPSTGVITAANGDTVLFRLTWTLQETSPGVFAVNGALTVTGGTGRYAEAGGSGEYQGWLDSIQGTCAFDGTYVLVR